MRRLLRCTFDRSGGQTKLCKFETLRSCGETALESMKSCAGNVVGCDASRETPIHPLAKESGEQNSLFLNFAFVHLHHVKYETAAHALSANILPT